MKKKSWEKMNYNFDVEFCQESISDVFRTIGALSRIRQALSCLRSGFSADITFYTSPSEKKVVKAFST